MNEAIEGDVWVRWTARSRQGAGAILGRGATPDSKPEHAKETLRRHGNVTVRPGGGSRSLEQAAAGNRAFPHPQIFPLLTEPLTMTLTGRGGLKTWSLRQRTPLRSLFSRLRKISIPKNHQQPAQARPPGPCSFNAKCRKKCRTHDRRGRVKSRRLSKATPRPKSRFDSSSKYRAKTHD